MLIFQTRLGSSSNKLKSPFDTVGEKGYFSESDHSLRIKGIKDGSNQIIFYAMEKLWIFSFAAPDTFDHVLTIGLFLC